MLIIAGVFVLAVHVIVGVGLMLVGLLVCWLNLR